MIIGILIMGGLTWLIFIGLPFLKKAKHFIKAISSKIYINQNANISKTEYRKILLGAIYSEQQTAYINSLETGLDANLIRSRLSEWWDINGRQDSIETLEYLRDKGHRFYTPTVLSAFSSSEDHQIDILQSYFKDEEDLHKAYAQLQHLKETYEELKSDKVINNALDIRKYGSAAWDCGRLVFVARLCFDAKYISQAEAWTYIEQAHQLASIEFNSWEAYAKSYVIGRALWGGENSFNSGIAAIAEYLLEDPKSPWKELSWS